MKSVHTNTQAVGSIPQRKGVVRMRLTFHIKKWTVTIIVRETSKKAKAKNAKKATATPDK